MPLVRQATIADAPRCAEIYAPFVTDGWISFEYDPPGPAEMADRIAQALRTHDWLVAELDGNIAGYAYAAPHSARAAYHGSCDVSVYVDPEASRQGVGRSLYEALFRRLKHIKMHAVFAGIALPNEASIALHLAMGFERVGVYKEVGRKMGAWRDVLWLQRLL